MAPSKRSLFLNGFSIMAIRSNAGAPLLYLYNERAPPFPTTHLSPLPPFPSRHRAILFTTGSYEHNYNYAKWKRKMALGRKRKESVTSRRGRNTHVADVTRNGNETSSGRARRHSRCYLSILSWDNARTQRDDGGGESPRDARGEMDRGRSRRRGPPEAGPLRVVAGGGM